MKSKTDLKRFIKWNTVVRHVRYNKYTGNFTVTAEDLKSNHNTSRHLYICHSGYCNI